MFIKNDMKRLGLILFFLSGIFFIFKTLFLGGHPDYFVYYSAAKAFLSGKNIYFASSGTAFIYPPFALFFILPFILLPFAQSQILWTCFSIVAFFVSLLLLFSMENERFFSNRFFLLFGSACYSFPAKFTLGMGQINMLILLLVTLFLYFQKKNKSTLATIFLGLSLNIKFFPFFSFVKFILKKQWKLLCLTLLFSFAFLILSFFVFRLNSFAEFIQNILPGIVNSTRSDYYNQALSGFVFRLVPPSIISEAFIRIISLILFGISSFVIWKSDKKYLPLVMGLLITLHLLIDSFSWQHYFVWLIIPYVQILYSLIRQQSKWYNYFPIILSYFLTQTNIKDPNQVPILLQSHVLYGTLILWGYILYILYRDDKHSLSH